MNPLIAIALGQVIDGVFRIWGNHIGKPEGWKPTDDEKLDFLALVDADTPEAIKAQARERLGLPAQ